MLNASNPMTANQEVLLNDAARGCAVTYAPHFLTETEADVLFDVLHTRTPFQTEAPPCVRIVAGLPSGRDPLGRAGVEWLI